MRVRLLQQKTMADGLLLPGEVTEQPASVARAWIAAGIAEGVGPERERLRRPEHNRIRYPRENRAVRG